MGCAPEPLKDPEVGKRNFRCGAVFFPCRQLGTSETSAALIIELPIFLFNPSKIPFETSTTSNWSNSVQFHIVRTILLRHPTNGNSGIGLRYISYIPTSMGLANTVLLSCCRVAESNVRVFGTHLAYSKEHVSALNPLLHQIGCGPFWYLSSTHFQILTPYITDYRAKRPYVGAPHS
jgi:hypothetical protein